MRRLLLGLLACLWTIALAWGMAELRLQFTSAPNSCTDQLNMDVLLRDSDLGYRLKPNYAARHKKCSDNAILYSVLYHSNPFGLRSPVLAKKPESTILLLGSSNLFGIGLADQQILAYQWQQELGERAQVINFSVFGYGPQQSLRILETNREAFVVAGRKVEAALLYADLLNIRRIANDCSWCSLFPNYQIDRTGQLVLVPHSTSERILWSIHDSLLIWSEAYSWLYNKLRVPERTMPDEYDVQRFLLIIKKIRLILWQRYQAPLVIFWDSYGATPNVQRLLKQCTLAGAYVITREQVFPGYTNPTYEIQNDGHHSPRFNAELARYLRQLNFKYLRQTSSAQNQNQKK